MKLTRFRVKNYKSIRDSGICYIPSDNVMVLAGQNESGKTAVLEGLHAFDAGEISKDDVALVGGENYYPEICCHFSVDEADIKRILDVLKRKKEDLPEGVIKKFLKDGVHLLRKYTGVKESKLFLVKNDESIETYNLRFEIEDEIKAQARLEAYLEEVAEAVWKSAPVFLYFNEISNILPSSIKLSDIVDKNDKAPGYEAVKNVEKILNVDFTKFATISDGLRYSRQVMLSNQFTADFAEVWKQHVDGVEKVKVVVAFEQGGSNEAPYLNFFVLSGENYLRPAQRSRGFQWFLSFYIELKSNAASGGIGSVILFDEPGLYLHSKAQQDISALFEEISASNQIIFSTHSPYLVDVNKLHRVKLVLNLPGVGTVIDKLTTNRLGQNLEALKPLRDALGLEACLLSSCAGKSNAICEGISDFYYFTAFRQLLGYKGNYFLIPSTGVTNVHFIVELCLGWGLGWFCLFDNDSKANKEQKKIVKSLGISGDEIDEMFHMYDFGIIEDAFVVSNYIALMGIDSTAGTMLEVIKANGNKELLSRLFLSKVNSGEISLNDIDPKTVAAFDKILRVVEDHFGET